MDIKIRKMKKMKIIIIGLMTFYCTTSGFSQMVRKSILLGGESKFSYYSSDSKWKSDQGNGEAGKMTSIQFSPRIGYFVLNGLVFGIQIPISYKYDKNEFEGETISNSKAIGPFIRYYLGKSIVKPYFQVEIGYGIIKEKYYPISATSNKITAELFIKGLSGGLGIFLNEKISLDIGFGYSSETITPIENNNTNFKFITDGFDAGIGIVVIF